MPHRASNHLVDYPAYCFPLSPTYNNWARLTATDVHNLRQKAGFEGQDIYFWNNHPIRWVRLVGVTVAVDILPTRFIFVLDDSSGATIDIVCERPKPKDLLLPGNASTAANDNQSKGITPSGRDVDLSGIDLGQVVKVKGVISVWRGLRQLALERVVRMASTNEEVIAWTENSSFHDDVLDKPWTLSDTEVDRAKKRVERDGKRKRSSRARKRNAPDEVLDAHEQVNICGNRTAKRQRLTAEDIRDHERKAREAELQKQLRQREKEKLLQETTRSAETKWVQNNKSRGSIIEQEASDSKQFGEQGEVASGMESSDVSGLDENMQTSNGRLKWKREEDRAERERLFVERTHAKKAADDRLQPKLVKMNRKARRTDNF